MYATLILTTILMVNGTIVPTSSTTATDFQNMQLCQDAKNAINQESFPLIGKTGDKDPIYVSNRAVCVDKKDPL